MTGKLKLTRNRSATIQRIVNALEELLAQVGIDGVSISLLAQQAGISKALIHRYFGGLEGLVDYYILLERTVPHFSVALLKQTQPLAPTNFAPFGSKQVLQLIQRVRVSRAIQEVYKNRANEENPPVDAVILSENIKAFFTEDRRKLVSVKAVEAMAGVPRNTLLNLLTVGRVIPKRHLESIVKVLKVIGYRPS